MTTTTCVYVKTRFTGFHRWKDAPEEVKFLRDLHRHVFHVTLFVEVGHGDREVEFFLLQRELDAYLQSKWHNVHFENSCEQVAALILKEFDRRGYKVFACKVSEDGENGAVVYVHDNGVSVPFQDLLTEDN